MKWRRTSQYPQIWTQHHILVRKYIFLVFEWKCPFSTTLVFHNIRTIMWTLLIVCKWFPLFHLIMNTTNPRSHFLFSLHVIWHLCQQSNFLIHCNIRQKGVSLSPLISSSFPTALFHNALWLHLPPSSPQLSFLCFLCLRELNTSFLFWMGSNPCFHIPFFF